MTHQTADFSPWRYLESVREFTNQDMVQGFIQKTKPLLRGFRAGYGIDDPVMSNFTQDDQGVHLVDLDHFGDRCSIYYQIGFVMADYDLRAHMSLTSSLEDLRRRYQSYGTQPIINEADALTLVIGYMSRLSIDVINHYKKLDSYNYEQSIRTLSELVKLSK